jgi:hypothetical protein
MNVGQRKRLMNGAAVATGLAAAVVLAGGLVFPVRVDVPHGQPGGPAAPATASAATSQQAAGGDDESRQLAELQQLCSVDLRKPLFEAPKVLRAAPVLPPLPAMTVRLVGLANEPGHSMAMFQKPDGSIVWCAPGESVDDASGPVTVTRIEPPKVVVQCAGVSHDLTPPATTQGVDHGP